MTGGGYQDLRTGRRPLYPLLACDCCLRLVKAIEDEHAHKNLVGYASPLSESLQLVDGAFLERDACGQFAALLQPFGGRKDLLSLEYGSARVDLFRFRVSRLHKVLSPSCERVER